MTCGIGDDSAILQIPPRHQLLVTTDLSIEDVHFRRSWHPARSAGHRCLARGLSDIAAMGGDPVACFLSLGLPHGLRQRWVSEFLEGLLCLAREYKAPLAGGDTSSASKITADIVVLGKVPEGTALLRSGARPGDRIYVTGSLGASAAMLQRLAAGQKVKPKSGDRHFFPVPRLEAGSWLRKRKIATSAIDLSDGLSVDLRHICEESGVSAVVEAAALPIARGANLEQALHGGEDYELLFTARKSTRAPETINGMPVTLLGEVLRRPAGQKASSPATVQLKHPDGLLRPLPPSGWEHFRKI